MQALALVALMGGLFGGSSERTVYVYYGAESPLNVGSISVNSPITNPSMLVCEDGYRTNFNSLARMMEEAKRTPFHSKHFDENKLKARSNRFRREFTVDRKAVTVEVPKCAIVWSSGVYREYPAFSIEISGVKFPHEVTRDVYRIMSGDNAQDVLDLKAGMAQIERDKQELVNFHSASPAQPQQAVPITQSVPAYVPTPLPAIPSIAPPAPPSRTTTVCRELGNGTVVCN